MTRTQLFNVLTLSAALGTLSLPAFAAPDGESSEPLRLVVELDPPMLFSGGVSGSVGLELGHFGFGVMGFGTPLSEGYRDWFLSDADGLDVPLNWGAEVWTDYYFFESRRWLFVGTLVSMDGFVLEDPTTGARDTVHALYVVPRAGVRLSLPQLDWLYLEPAIGAPIKVWDDASASPHDVGVRPATWLPFFSVGVTVPLGRQG